VGQIRRANRKSVGAGGAYQEIVAAVERALHPEANVDVGEWIEGPDGEREVDVVVRGKLGATHHVALIECKDWRRPVDIKTIDELDSKRNDLGADTTLVYSNSGFTKKALNKAQRKNIQAVSALNAGNADIKLTVRYTLTPKFLSIDRWIVRLYPDEESNRKIPSEWLPQDLIYNDLPVVNWIRKASADVLLANEDSSEITAIYAFKEPTQFALGAIKIALLGIGYVLECSKCWLSQTVGADLSLGQLDHGTGQVWLPDKQRFMLGPIDTPLENWQRMDRPPAAGTSGAPFVDVRLLLRKIPEVPGAGTPDIDAIIADSRIVTKV
jgi:hypothetical protein